MGNHKRWAPNKLAASVQKECYVKAAHLQCVSVVAIHKITPTEDSCLKAEVVVQMQLIIVKHCEDLHLGWSQFSSDTA